MFETVLTANFTGYVLPWDQLAYWAVTVSTGMLDYIPWVGLGLKKMIRGGADIGPGTLRILFGVHTAVVPAALSIGKLKVKAGRIRIEDALTLPGKMAVRLFSILFMFLI